MRVKNPTLNYMRRILTRIMDLLLGLCIAGKIQRNSAPSISIEIEDIKMVRSLTARSWFFFDNRLLFTNEWKGDRDLFRAKKYNYFSDHVFGD